VKAEIRLPKVKQPHTTISPFNPSQMKSILYSFDTKTYLGLRNYTIIRLFLDTGLQSSELSRLQLTDVNLEDGFVSVLGGLHKSLHPFLTKYSQISNLHPPS
jgi:integrase/recombinase XerD